MTDLQIPADLLPVDGRFGSGPSKVRQAQVDALSAAAPHYLGTSHRKPGVKGEVKRLREGLRDLFSLPEGYEVILGNGGTTAFWDIATFGLIEARGQFLSFGEFGSKFAKAAATAPHLGDMDIRTFEPGTAGPFEPGDFDVYASPHNETSTGVAIEAVRPAGTGDALVMFDATSAAGGLPVVAEDFDVYYFAPQKCFASDGGLWFALMSPRALGTGRHDRCQWPLGAGVPGPVHRDRQLPPGADLQHPGAGHDLPDGRAGRLVQRQRWAEVGGRPQRRAVPRTCTAGRTPPTTPVPM
ncbi:MAG: hypothetical protein V9G10_06795 [Candidatus Nanopelagicales bacterium]